jgi:cephalosporin hydroxylase
MKRLVKQIVNAALGPFGAKIVRRRKATSFLNTDDTSLKTGIELEDRRASPLMLNSEMSLREWSYYHSSAVLGVPNSDEDERGPIRMKYFGIPLRKNPLDLWIYQEMIFDLKPDLIIEIGSAHGGSTLWLAHQLDLLGDDRAKVLSLDIDRTPYLASHPRITELTGDSASEEIVRQVKPHCESASVVLILHDGNHSAEGVTKDLAAYADMVTPGSYLVVEDGLGDVKRQWGESQYTGEGGPLKAVLEFLKTRDDYQIDYDKERYILTQNNLGFLRRVR